jgi:hypothetical protein
MRRSPASASLVSFVSLVSSMVTSLVAPTRAFGQGPPPPPQPYAVAPTQPPPGYVPLVLQGAVPGMSYEIAPDGKNTAPIAGCPTDCMVYVPPGKYRITVGETLDTRSGKRVVDVFLPTRAFVEPRTKSDKETGLIMGIGGSALVVTGIVGLVVSLTANTHCPDGFSSGSTSTNRCKTEWTTGATLSLLAMIAGCVLTPIGWVQFGRSAPTVTSSPLTPSPAPPPRVSFDIVPLRKSDAASLGGGLLVGKLAF